MTHVRSLFTLQRCVLAVGGGLFLAGPLGLWPSRDAAEFGLYTVSPWEVIGSLILAPFLLMTHSAVVIFDSARSGPVSPRVWRSIKAMLIPISMWCLLTFLLWMSALAVGKHAFYRSPIGHILPPMQILAELVLVPAFVGFRIASLSIREGSFSSSIEPRLGLICICLSSMSAYTSWGIASGNLFVPDAETVFLTYTSYFAGMLAVTTPSIVQRAQR